jgi:NADH dehydrogenase (ubiquinone) 1 alpha/beta subcomplex 1
MFRAALPALRSSLPAARFALARPVARAPAPIVAAKWRAYSAAAGLSKDDISSRVMEVMKTFEKVDGGKVGSGLGV